MITGIARYGLQENPYAPKEINPLKNEKDEKLLIPITGFKYEEIDRFLQDKIKANQLPFFLITGRDRSGRSSFANYILNRYRVHRKIIDPYRFIVPNRYVESHDHFGILRSWLKFLRNDLNKIKAPINDLKEEFQEVIKSSHAEGFEPDFQYLLYQVSESLNSANSPIGFGVCFENVSDCNLIKDALTICEDAKTVCVFTVQDYGVYQEEVIKPFEAIAKEKAKEKEVTINLMPIKGSDVKTLLHKRWEIASNLPCPFQKIESTFEDKERTVGLILHLASKALDLKVVKPGQPWTGVEEELEFSDIELDGMIKVLDGEP
jgi:hypothetical protein